MKDLRKYAPDEGADGGGSTPPDTKTPPKEEDQFKQLKGEFNRKLTDTNKLIEQMSQTNAQLTQKLDALINPKPKPQKEEPLDRLMYSDPVKYTQLVEERATAKAVETMRNESQGQGAIQARIASLASEYPELSDNESPLTKATVELLKAANAMQKSDPNTYEYAVLKAAQQLDVRPRSKRPKTEDDFVAASYASPQSRTRRQSEDKVIKDNRDIAKAFGVNLDDEKTKQRYVKILKDKGLA